MPSDVLDCFGAFLSEIGLITTVAPSLDTNNASLFAVQGRSLVMNPSEHHGYAARPITGEAVERETKDYMSNNGSCRCCPGRHIE